MAVTLATLTPLEDSLFLTLYARALDNRRAHRILNVALRAKKLDQVASTATPGPPSGSPSTPTAPSRSPTSSSSPA
jgi:hypothetical protein